MKRLILLVMITATLGVNVSVSVRAADPRKSPKTAKTLKTLGLDNVDIQQRPKDGLPIDAFSKKNDTGILTEPRYDVLGLVKIESFGPTRRPASSLRGVIVSKLFKPVEATYKISKWNGSAWKQYSRGNVTIPANGSTSVSTRVRFTTDAMFFKLEVSAPSSRISLSKQYRKAATPKPKFVVRYGTSGNRTEGHWVMAGVWSTDNTPIDKVQLNSHRLEKQMQGFGFEVQRRTKHDLHFFDGQTYRIAIYIRTSEMLEREFDTREEAVAFHDSLRAAIPDSNLTVEDIRTR
jgi:hypothetical protein